MPLILIAVAFVLGLWQLLDGGPSLDGRGFVALFLLFLAGAIAFVRWGR